MIARKVMLLGDIGVGKSSVVQRLIFDRFDFNYKPTIGVDVYRYEIADVAGGDGMSLIIWDTDGNFGEAIFRHVYMKEASAAVILADASRPQTVQTMARLAEGFGTAMPGRYVGLVFNKIDLVSSPGTIDLPPELARFGAPPIRTSAKTGFNVRQVFKETAEAIQRRGQ